MADAYPTCMRRDQWKPRSNKCSTGYETVARKTARNNRQLGWRIALANTLDDLWQAVILLIDTSLCEFLV